MAIRTPGERGVIVPLEHLTARLAAHGIRPLYPNSGRFAFAGHVPVKRWCWLSGPDPTIRPELRSACRELGGVGAVAHAVAAHLAGLRLDPIWLVPHVHWEHELLDGPRAVWEQVLAGLGVAAADPGLTGGNAVEFRADVALIEAVVGRLLPALDQSSVLLLADAPLIVRLHPNRQVWLNSSGAEYLPVEGGWESEPW